MVHTETCLFNYFRGKGGREVLCSCTLLDLSKFVFEGFFVNGKRRGGFAVWVQLACPSFVFVLVLCACGRGGGDGGGSGGGGGSGSGGSWILVCLLGGSRVRRRLVSLPTVPFSCVI